MNVSWAHLTAASMVDDLWIALFVGAAFFLLLLPAVEGDERVARESGDGEEG